LSTMDTDYKGELMIDGQRMTNLKVDSLAAIRNEKIGFVFQFHHLLAEFTAIENVCIPAFIKGRSRIEAENEAKKILDFLNLSDRIEHKPGQLSGGEQQRVAVARALINNPSVILADEPSGNLDSVNKKELHELFFKLRDKYNQTFIIVTHDNGLAEMSDRVLRIKDGVIVNDAGN
ncbi:MAG: ABC transporter ATP-binding protein, partial [Chloroflexia bacterium]|nr:ABC transporter ATP-binding protein [Chloroflexia bacterium]